jgi:acyl-CoA reductase-like NAD-dependent aldehyde dehydrogenase
VGPEDGGVGSGTEAGLKAEQWRDAVFTDGQFRQSGLGGRSGGDANIEEFTERRWLTVNTEPAHYPY